MTGDPFSAAGMENPGVYRITVPTPFPVGRINVYLIKDERPALIDTGPHSERSLGVLREGLEKHGVRLADIRRILITHPHMDHFGLASWILQEADAEIFVPEAGRAEVERFEAQWARGDAFLAETFPRLGVPHEYIDVILGMSEPLMQFARALPNVRGFEPGHEFAFDRFRLRAVHTPGHTPWCASLHCEQGRFLFSGDFLLRKITSNPLMHPPEERTGAVHRPLLVYLESLARVRKLDLDLVLTGHGEPIPDHRRTIDRIREHHRRRAIRILRHISDGPLTPFELSGRLFRNLPVAETFLGISEVMAHLEWLIERGEAEQVEEGDFVKFKKLQSASP